MNKTSMCSFYVSFRLNVPNGCSVELSHKGYQYLSSLFERHDKDKDGALCPKEVEAIFSVCPTAAFNSCISNMVPTNPKVHYVHYFEYSLQFER